jgi:hypothetical protein
MCTYEIFLTPLKDHKSTLSLGFTLTSFTLSRVLESNSSNWHRRRAAEEEVEQADEGTDSARKSISM